MQMFSKRISSIKKESSPAAGSRKGHAGVGLQRLLFLLLATLTPLLIVLSVEVWMVTAYSGGFEPHSFITQYTNGIYRYRIIGREVVIQLYRYLNDHFADHVYPLPRSPNGSFLFYAAYAISNGLYFCAANFFLLVLMWKKGEGLSDSMLAAYFSYTFILSMSMAVVTPYDQLAYLLLLLGFWGTTLKTNFSRLMVVCVSVIIGTLNRESEFLIVPALMTMRMYAPSRAAKNYGQLASVSAILFTTTYVTLRVILPGPANVIQSLTAGGKWGVESLFVFALLILVELLLLARVYPDVRLAAMLLLLSSPYLAAIVVGGALRELRLLVPLILSMTCTYFLCSRAEVPLISLEDSRSVHLL